MSLHFKFGGLDRMQREWAEQGLRKYPYVVYMRQHLDHAWIERNLVESEYLYENDMGPDYMKSCVLYSCFKVGGGDTGTGVLYFFKLHENYVRVVQKLNHDVISANPFDTKIQDTRPVAVKQAEYQATRRLTFWERVRAVFHPLPMF